MFKKAFGALCVCFILVLIGSAYQKHQLNKKIDQITAKYKGVKRAYLLCDDQVKSLGDKLKTADKVAEDTWGLSVNLQKELDECKRMALYFYRYYLKHEGKK